MSENDKAADNPPAEPKRTQISGAKFMKSFFIVILASIAGFIHYRYVSILFENDRNFSHLSEMEREMSLQSELGFYYSYYKTVVYERPFMTGISKLMNDRLVEFPNEVNAFNRFNIYPEVLIGSLYRYLEPVLNTTGHRECHIVSREGLPPVKSCVGLGEPIMFYLEAVWLLQGCNVAALFLQATALSNTVLGGILAVIQYFTNHVECTRVHWSPNQRENMAVPFLVLQLWLVSVQLRDGQRRRQPSLQIPIFILNCICHVFWQFTQFIFLTQIFIFFIMEQLKIINLETLYSLLHPHFCGLYMAIVLLEGNNMLKLSLYTSFLLTLHVYLAFLSSYRINVKNRKDFYLESLFVILRITVFICFSIYFKKYIGEWLGYKEDTHILDILYSKFTNFKNFHTLLYTCSPVFDYLPLNSVKKLFHSFLIPFVILSVINVVKTWFIEAFNRKDKNTIAKKKEVDDTASDEIKQMDTEVKDTKLKQKDVDIKDGFMCFLKNLTIDPAIFYNISQMVVYGVMAGLIMRLKMLFVPQMCVVSSLMMNKDYYKLPSKYMKYILFFWALSILPVLRVLTTNVKEELSYIGEYSDPHKERLMEWIQSESSRSVFAGSMPLMATVLLVARRAVVTHPHYENQGARERAYAVYKMYGRFTSQELYDGLSKLGVTHLILENSYCFGRSSLGCTYSEIWEADAAAGGPRLQGGAPLCELLLRTRAPHLYPVYKDTHYTVFRVHDYSVSYMPRSADT